MAGLLLLGNDFGDGNENFDCEQTNAVLIVVDKVLEQGYHLLDHNGCRLFLDEFGEVCGGLTTDHGSIIVDQQAELLAKLLLDRRRDLLVWGCEKTTSRNLGCEPVGFCEADGERDEVLFDLLR